MFFVGADHLGSTQVLTCHKQPAAVGCSDRAVYRFYRYDAYGNAKAYLPSGSQVGTWQEPTDRLYTGQTWDQAAGVYYYNARFYDPKLALFSSLDPVREHTNPYAYVTWGPLRFVDPSGMITVPDAGGAAGMNFVLGGHISGGSAPALGDLVRDHLTRGGSRSLGLSPMDSSRLDRTSDPLLALELVHVLLRSGAGINAVNELNSLGALFESGGLSIADAESAASAAAASEDGLETPPFDLLDVLAAGGVIAAGARSIAKASVREMAVRFGTSSARVATLEKVLTSAGGIRTTDVVARQLLSTPTSTGSRAYIPTQSILDTIGSGVRAADPQGAAGYFMYTSPASFNSSTGILEVLVNEVNGVVSHAMYKSGR